MALPTDGLRTFVAVAERRSFTQAGRAVNRTQSAVSMQIKRMEEELGRPLFLRAAGKVDLTPEGETFLGYARRMLKLHDQALAAVADPGLSGVVRFGSPEIYGPRFLPRILSRFADACPRVQVDVRCDPSRVLEAMVDDGALDMAVLTQPEPSPGCEVIHRESVAWAVSESCNVHERSPVPVAVFDQGCFMRAWALSALEASGKGSRVAYVSPSTAGILAAVEAGLAVAPVAVGSVRPGMRVLGPEEGFPLLPSAVVVLKRAARPGSRAGDKLAAIVVEGFRRARISGVPD